MTETVQFTPHGRGLLEGVRVVDLSRLVAGNMTTHVLADYGADVIKVERPGKGDDLRSWRVEGIEVFWKVYARHKRSLVLDIQDEEGRAGEEFISPLDQKNKAGGHYAADLVLQLPARGFGSVALHSVLLDRFDW